MYFGKLVVTNSDTIRVLSIKQTFGTYLRETVKYALEIMFLISRLKPGFKNLNLNPVFLNIEFSVNTET